MNILLLGYGRMGKIIEQISQEKGHQIAGRISIENKDEIHDLDTQSIDVAIEFSQPEAAVENIMFCLKNNIPVVSGTTGWLKDRQYVEEQCNELDGAFFYASNFSIGVNLFFKLNEKLATMMSEFDDYKSSMTEIHHIHKKDAPSGTAISLAEGIIANHKKYKEWSLDNKEDNIIQIDAIRENEVPGTHSIKYTSKVDDIEITHTAHSREGFAKGAVLVAEWIKDKKGILSMNDFLAI